MTSYSESELILNPDGTVFHLQLLPGQISDTIILVGDPGRVDLVGGYLEGVERLASNREFTSISGYFKGTPLTVLSTGIGTDNIDIVVNELDALANINFDTRTDHPVARSLKLIRIGTSGSLQPDLEAGSAVASAWSIGLDGLMKYYHRAPDPDREQLMESFLHAVRWPSQLPQPYAARAGNALLNRVQPFCHTGITVAAHGFYGPQGRQLRAPLELPDLNDRIQAFRHGNLRATNFEMESSALYGLSELLGHEAITVCLIIANRMTKTFLGDYKPAMKELILNTLNAITG